MVHVPLPCFAAGLGLGTSFKKTGPKPRQKVEQLSTWVTCKKNTENKTTKGLISITIVDLGTNWKVVQFLRISRYFVFSAWWFAGTSARGSSWVTNRITWCPGGLSDFVPLFWITPPFDGHHGNKSSSSPSFPKVPTNNAGRFNFSQYLLLANEPHKRLESSVVEVWRESKPKQGTQNDTYWPLFKSQISMLLRIYLDLSPTKPRYATSFASLNGCYQEAGSGRASDIGAAGYQQLRFLQAHQTTDAQPRRLRVLSWQVGLFGGLPLEQLKYQLE